MNDFVEILTRVGVPVACMIALGLYVLKRDKRDAEKDAAHADQIKSIMETHKTEIAELRAENSARMEKLTEAVNNNTVAMTQLSERIGGLN